MDSSGGTITDFSSSPVRVPGLARIAAIAGGTGTGYALRSDGTVWAWGHGSSGELGNGTVTRVADRPVRVAGLTRVKAIAAGDGSAYAIRRDGTVWAWGSGQWGALGNGKTSHRTRPVRVAGLRNIVAISSSDGATKYAVRSDGTVWAWGSGKFGALGNGRSASHALPVRVLGMRGAVAVAGAANTGYALKKDGTVWSWGLGSTGQLGNGRRAISTRPVRVLGLTRVKSIAAGGDSGYALQRDGRLWSWGDNSYGQLGDFTNVTRFRPVLVYRFVLSIAAGDFTAYMRSNSE
jgi:alpha-tubulin suppressor-like RCC1 family protein